MLRLALAYILRRPVQLLAIMGIAVGITALLVVLSVMNGLIDLNRQAIKSTQSDLHLTPVVSDSVQAFDDYQRAILDVDGVAAVAPRLVAYAMFSTPGYYTDYSNSQAANHNGIQVVGIDYNLERMVSDFDLLIADIDDKQNCFATQSVFPRPGLIVSESFMSTLPPAIINADGKSQAQLELGALPAVLPPADQDLIPHNATANIANTYKARNFRSAMNVVFMQRTGINGLRYNLLGNNAPEFTELLIKVKDGANVNAVKQQIIASLSKAHIDINNDKGFVLETWQQRSATILSAIDNERRMVAIILMFVVLVSAFGLFASLSALVREKTRDLGVLSALGYSPASRANLLMITGGVASILGCSLGWLGARAFFNYRLQIIDFLRDGLGVQLFDPKLYVVDGIPAQWLDGQASLVISTCFVLCIIFTSIPAIRAALLSPVNALRNN
ncbi:MAG: ABC transporter permease [Planctomycetes bacterium]|nr:ABC transporter permease [Planctomycetota bacterium]